MASSFTNPHTSALSSTCNKLWEMLTAQPAQCSAMEWPDSQRVAEERERSSSSTKGRLPRPLGITRLAKSIHSLQEFLPKKVVHLHVPMSFIRRDKGIHLGVRRDVQRKVTDLSDRN